MKAKSLKVRQLDLHKHFELVQCSSEWQRDAPGLVLIAPKCSYPARPLTKADWASEASNWGAAIFTGDAAFSAAIDGS